MLDEHEIHHSTEVVNYYEENIVALLFMPPESSNVFKMMVINFFSVLKRSYSMEIGKLIRNHIHQITKPDFIAFYDAFWAEFSRFTIKKVFYRL